MLNLDVVLEGRLIAVALAAALDRAVVHPGDLGGLPPIVSLFLREPRDEELHAEELLVLLKVRLWGHQKERERVRVSEIVPDLDIVCFPNSRKYACKFTSHLPSFSAVGPEQCSALASRC